VIDTFSVSVKGVVLLGTDVVLLKNERDEWELPGGRLSRGEDPETCLRREVIEETKLILDSQVQLLDCWLYKVVERDFSEVLIVTYGCRATRDQTPIVSEEHSELGIFAVSECDALHMPDGYKQSIATWSRAWRADYVNE
jgi:8-oxo-dGTP pyrophosphatase MutT (NUDIX family)